LEELKVLGGTLELFVKYLELGGTEYRGQKSKVGTKTVICIQGKKRKKEKKRKEKRGDQIDLKLRVLSTGGQKQKWG
jgi:hypothetical protein